MSRQLSVEPRALAIFRLLPQRSFFKLILLAGLVISVTASALLLVRRRANSAKWPISTENSQRDARAKEAYGSLPLSFEANLGQIDPQVKYIARGPGYSLYLTPHEAVLGLSTALARPDKAEGDSAKIVASAQTSVAQSVLRMSIEHANPATNILGQDELSGRSNYFIGNDSRKWVRGVPNVAKVKYEEIYPGIDLTYYGNQRQLEYDFVIQPGTDPKQIALNFDGADKIKLDHSGDLVLIANGREVRQHRPVAYQEIAGQRREVGSRFVLTNGNRIQFALDAYDTTRPLVIDPVLVYQTYFGGTGNESATAVAVNSAGEAFITGIAPSLGFPGSPLQGANGAGGDAFVVKLNATGTAVVFSSYFGGGALDSGNGIAVDPSGNVYVAGQTQSFNFPTAGPAYQSSKRGGPQMRKTTDGGANYSAPTLAGLSTANVNGVAVHPTDPNTAVVTSFGGEGVYKTTDGGASWVSIRGTIPDTFNNAVAIDPSNPSRLYVAACGPGGIYRSSDGGATWSATSVLGSCMNTVIVDPAGAVYAGGFDGQGLHKSTDGGVTWTTYSVGGSFTVPSLALDPNNPNILYAQADQGVYKSLDAGVTWSVTGLSTGDAFDDALAVDPNNSQIVYTVNSGQLRMSSDGGASWIPITNLGLSANGVPTAVMIAPTNPSTVFVGSTTDGVLKSTDNGVNWIHQSGSTDDVSAMAFAPSNNSIVYLGLLSGADAFVTKLDPSGSTILYSTYLGGGAASSRGDKDDNALGIAVDATGVAYVGGFTDSTDFPTVNPLQAFGGTVDAFFARLDATGSNLTYCTTFGGSAVDTARGIALSPGGSVFIAGRTDGGITTVNAAQGTAGGGQDAFVARLNPAGNNYSIAYSTYLGGAGADLANAIAIDSANNAFIVGQTATAGLATAGAAQVTKGTANDGFLARFDQNGVKTFFTYIGGTGAAGGQASLDAATSVAVDSSGAAYVGGYTRSSGFPTANSLKSFNATTCGALPCLDPFVTKINPSGSARVFSTLLGGDGDDQAFGVALDSSGAVYVTGTTSSTESRPGSLQPNNGGGVDAFIVKLAMTSDLSVTLTDSPDPVSVNNTLTYTATVTNSGEGTLTGVTLSNSLPANTTFVSANPSQGSCSGTTSLSCNLGSLNAGQNVTVTIQVTPTKEGSLTNTVSATCNEAESNSSNNSASQDTRVTVGTVYTVNSGADTDDGACTATGTGNGCTLREAINAANANSGKDTILFNIGTGLQTITLASSLPSLNSAVFVDATSQSGFAGQPIIEINGASAAHCLFIPNTSSGSTVRGFVINRCGGHGIQIDGGNNTIQGNYIGTNASGTATAPVTFSGIFINGSNNQIGGTAAADRNVISGNGHQGIAITGSNNAVQGNYVGTNATGTGALGGGNVAIFQGGSNNMIGGSVGTTPGGSCSGACNLISGNSGPVSLGSGGGGTNNTVQGNYVGVNPAGTAAIPNSSGGIRLMGVSGNHIIGNLVSGNNGTGVSLFDASNPTANNDIRGNFIGTNAAGTAAIPNTGGGIEMHAGASGNIVGGSTAADRNVVSGNSGDGIALGNLSGASTGNLIKGNNVGTNAAGNAILGNTGQGVSMYGATNNIIGGSAPGEGNLISGNNANGVNISSRSPGSGLPPAPATGNHVEGNLIGTNITGMVALRNNANGIAIASSNGNFIGNTTAGARNVISGNTQAGISISNSGGFDPAGSNGNVIRGNFIGTKADGNQALPNGNQGILIGGGSAGTIIGGDDAADGVVDGVVRARNLISGNSNDGINASNGNGQSNNTVIQGNYIGVNLSGTAPLPNNFSGIAVSGVNATQIGGTSAGAGNLISGNNQNGINMNESNTAAGQPLLPVTNTHVEGNFIGTNAAGTAAIRNQQAGVGISGTNSSNNYVGGSVPGARNLIGANGGNAVTINPNANGNFVLGNWMGVDITGTTSLVTNLNGVISYGNGSGVVITGSSNNQIGGLIAAERNVISGNGCQGVNILNNLTNGVLTQASGNRVQGNYIGLNAAGTDMVIDPTNGSKFGNKCSDVFIGGATNNLIGGTAPGAGNVLVGANHQGVVVSNNNNVIGSGNTIRGNIIGANAAMTVALPNPIDVFLINGASNNTIGGDDAADGTVDGVVNAGNKIFASAGDGINIQSAFVNGANALATGNVIQGNLIGGSTLLRNTGNGINLNGAVNTQVGGGTAGAGNTISFNGNNGIVVNCLVLNGVVKCGVGNTFSQNSIFSQPSNLGIRLNNNGTNFGNNNQANPVLSFVSVTAGNTTAQGTLASVANSQFTLEFFVNDACDSSGAGEGQTFIGSTQVTTDGSGNAGFNVSSLNSVPVGKIITATATNSTNGTSRFSTCVVASSATATISGRAQDQTGNPMPGATVTLSGGQNAAATTDAQGNYSFPNLVSNLGYTVSASLAGVTFYPASFTLTNLPADRTVNFTKAVAGYTITDLGALTPGPTSIAWDVNNAGQVAGWHAAVAPTNFRQFFYDNGTITTLTPLGTGTNAQAIAIGDSGRMVGYSELVPQGPNGSFTVAVHGTFSDNGGAVKEIGTLGGTNSRAWGVNDNGAVVGEAQLSNGQTRPYLWRDANNDGLWQQSEMLDLGPINGATFGRGFAINNNNVVVGNSTDAGTNFTLATLWKDDNGNGVSDPGELRALGNLGGNNANASGINDNGYVVGTSEIAGLASNGRVMQRGFIWHDDNGNGVADPGEMKNLGTAGGEFSNVLRINSNNEIIGWSDVVGINTPRAIRWKNNFMLDLNASIPQNSGWVLTEARGVSDNGKIAGYGTINGVQHAYLLTPSLISQTVTFNPLANRIYGDASFTVTATASSTLPVTFSVLSGPATVSGNTVTITGAGSVTLRATQVGDSTYDSAIADQTFTVAPALLRVIADSKTKVFGAPNPAFTVHYSGFVNGDGANSLSGSLSFTTAADNSPAGSYSITPSGLASNNYTFQYLSATLTIDQAATSTSSGNYHLTVPGAVNLIAQVTGDSPSTLAVGQGTVTFVVRQGATTIGTVTSGQVSNGQASATFTVPAGGAYTIYASYGGSGNYLGSTGLASLTVGNANPIPSITGVTPDSAVKKPTETGQFTLLIDGNGFMAIAIGDPANSSVDWFDRTTGQHTNLSLTSITASQIQAVVPYTLIRDGKTVEVSVINPGPGGGASNVQPFFVTDTTATVTSTETVIPDPVTGTASTTSVTPSGAVLSAEASSGGSGGTGTLSVAQYNGDPIGTNSSPNTSAFSTAEGGGYFDVYVAPGSSFTSLTFEYSNTGGTTIYWWDGTVWALVSNQSYNPATGTITVTVTTTSSPSIAQLTGTVFGVASGPSVGAITVTPSATVALGSGPITLNATIVDANGAGPYTAEIKWGDNQTNTLVNLTGPVLSASHAYSSVGSYSVSVKVSRGSSFGTLTFSPVVVFDANAGTMNADGWFNAPLGSFPVSPAFTGKIHFESNVKYNLGATLPTGTAKVNLPGKDFNANSLSYLTINGSSLQVSGTGTINNAGSYGFLLTGIDGKLDGKKMPDKVRIRIWDRATGAVIYDSQMNAADSAAPTIVLGGGTVNIKK